MTDTWSVVLIVTGCAATRTPAKALRIRFTDEPEDRELEALMERHGAESAIITPPTTGLES